MSTETVTFEIRGLTPILMHCGQTADPLNPFAKAMKQLSKKRQKTDDDLAVMGMVEWWAGLYLSEPAIVDASAGTVTPAAGSKIEIPAHVLDSCIREGARKQKMGKQASAGCIVEGPGTFEHDGPRDLSALAANPKYTNRSIVRVGAAKVVRCRPVFPVWSIRFSVMVDTTVLEIDQVRQCLDSAGKLVGIGDWRPGAPRGGSFGRFVVA